MAKRTNDLVMEVLQPYTWMARPDRVTGLPAPAMVWMPYILSGTAQVWRK